MKMAPLIPLFAILLILMPFTLWGKNREDVAPENNYCSPLVDSKKYLSNDFSANYPRTVSFECAYECNANGKKETIHAISTIRIFSLADDATDVVCQGVIVKKVAWGYDFDRVVPFYAYSTNLVEIKRWAFENISLDPKINNLENSNLSKLKISLMEMSDSFFIAGKSGNEGSSSFKEAAEILKRIAGELPQKTILLDEVIKEIVLNKGPGKIDGTAKSIVYAMISSSAAWRIP